LLHVIAIEGVLSRGDVFGIVTLQHVAEVSSLLIDAPKLIRTRDELAVAVPAFDPCDTVVKAEEPSFVPFALRVLDLAVLLAHLVIWS
jgi:hypothetical protein